MRTTSHMLLLFADILTSCGHSINTDCGLEVGQLQSGNYPHFSYTTNSAPGFRIMLSTTLSEYTFRNVYFIHLLEQVTLLLVLAYTRANTLIRTATLPVMFLIFVQAMKLDSSPDTRKLYRVLLSDWASVVLLQYIDTALISRWDWSHGGPTSFKGGTNILVAKTPAASRLCWALEVTTNQRWTRTPWEIKNIPPFSTREPNYTPSRSKFVIQRLLIATVTYMTVNILSSNHADPAVKQVMFSVRQEKVFSRLSEISGEEIIKRVIVTSTIWITIYCIVTTIYNVISVLAVATGIYESADWRPLFGKLGQLTTVRGFWNGFWQQGMRTRFSHPAHYVVYHVLGLQHGDVFSRYLFIFLTFAVSGVVHAVGDIAAGIEWRESGSMEFFCVQALGIMFEDAVQALYTACSDDPRSNGWHKWIGYCWTITWLCWTSPVWHFPMLRNDEGSEADAVMPFDVLKFLKKAAT